MSSAQHLLDHLLTLNRTYDRVSKQNESKLMSATNGTMNITKRSLKVLVDSLPNFSGEEATDMVTWVEFQASMLRIKEIQTFNLSDAIAQFLSKVHNPARLHLPGTWKHYLLFVNN